MAVNGEPIGFSTDSRLPAEFEITSAISPGSPALIALRVNRWSASSRLEDQDMWWMAGIHRAVRLYATEPTYLADAFVATEWLAPSHREAEIAVELEVGGDAAHSGLVRAELELVGPGAVARAWLIGISSTLGPGCAIVCFSAASIPATIRPLWPRGQACSAVINAGPTRESSAIHHEVVLASSIPLLRSHCGR